MSEKDKEDKEVKQGLMPSYDAFKKKILDSISSVDSHDSHCVNKAGLLPECNDFISCCDCYRFHGNGIPPCAQKKEKKI